MLTKKDRAAIIQMMDDYGRSEAEKYLEKQLKKRKEYMKEISDALEVMAVDSPQRPKLESKLAALLLGAGVEQEALAAVLGHDGAGASISDQTPKKVVKTGQGQYL